MLPCHVRQIDVRIPILIFDITVYLTKCYTNIKKEIKFSLKYCKDLCMHLLLVNVLFTAKNVIFTGTEVTIDIDTLDGWNAIIVQVLKRTELDLITFS